MLKSPRTEFVTLHALKRLEDLQMREGPADEENFARLREIVESGGKLPPCEAVSDGRVYWLTDGYMRTTVLEMCDKGSVECVVYPGTFLDAQMRALRANAGNGCGRTDADRRKAILKLINTPDLLAKARQVYVGGGLQFAIAAACQVSISTVKRVMDSEGLFIHHGEIQSGKRPEPLKVCVSKATNYASNISETIASDYEDGPDEDEPEPPKPKSVIAAPAANPHEQARSVAKIGATFLHHLTATMESLLEGPRAGTVRNRASKAGCPIPDDISDWTPIRVLRSVLAD